MVFAHFVALWNSAEALPVLGDRIQLQQVILNLAVNGIEAMNVHNENRIISIRTSRVDNFAQLSVPDRASGIPESKLKELFEPFFTSKAEGMGMGFSLARTTVEAHHGVITVKKNWDLDGATFRIKLPLSSDGFKSSSHPTGPAVGAGLGVVAAAVIAALVLDLGCAGDLQTAQRPGRLGAGPGL